MFHMSTVKKISKLREVGMHVRHGVTFCSSISLPTRSASNENTESSSSNFFQHVSNNIFGVESVQASRDAFFRNDDVEGYGSNISADGHS